MISKFRNLLFLFLLAGCAANPGVRDTGVAPEVQLKPTKGVNITATILEMFLSQKKVQDYYYYQNQPAPNQIRH